MAEVGGFRLDRIGRRGFAAVSELAPELHRRLRRRLRRPRVRKKWEPLRCEAEIVLRAAAVTTSILWAKRLVEQLLGKRWLIEAVLKNEIASIVHETEQQVNARYERTKR